MSRKAVLATTLGAVVLVAIVGSAPASAGSDDVTMCVAKSDGAVRVIKDGGKCARGEYRITVNQQGIRGPKGATGARGATGAQGPRGATGPSDVYYATEDQAPAPASPNFGTVVSVDAPAGTFALSYTAVVENLTAGDTILDCRVGLEGGNLGDLINRPAAAVPGSGRINWAISGVVTLNEAATVIVTCADAGAQVGLTLYGNSLSLIKVGTAHQTQSS